MNQIYSKTRYLFLLLGFLISSVGMAQSPLQKTRTGNVPMAVQSPSANQKKDQVSKKTNDPNSAQDNVGNDLSNQQDDNIAGQKLSSEESELVKKQVKASEKLRVQNLSSSKEQSTQQDTISKVKSFAKSSNLTVKNVFEVKKESFGLTSSDRMQLKSVSDKHGRSLATYQQLHNSIPVEGAIYKVRENKTKIDAFGSVSKKLPAASNYKINAAAALENALRTINAKQYVWESKKLSSLVHEKISKKPQGELVYVGPNFSSELTEYHLAWKYDIFAINPQSSQTIYVDANTGKIILKIDLNRDVRIAGQSLGKGKARYAGNVVFNTTQYDDGYRLEAEQGKYKVPIYTLNMNHSDYPSDDVITDYIDEDNNWNELYNKDGDEVAIDIHWGLQKAIDYYEEKFDRNSVDNKGMTIFGLAHLGTNVENASWTGGWAQFGDGTNNSPYVSLGITGHELTHAVTQFSAGLIYKGESGAMNESFSDIFGVSIELYAGKDTKNDIWMLGDELYNHGSLRSMSNPKAQGQPDTYEGVNWAKPANLTYDNGGVHINSGITNYWFYLLNEGGSGVNDINESYDVKAIGIAKAEKIAYLTLTEYLSPASTFSDMRAASLLATEDLYGLASEEYKQVTNAWHAIGIGPTYSDKQISIVSVEDPTALCGTLKGDEPFYVKIKNTGNSVIKANEILNYKLRLMVPSRGTFATLYTNAGTVSFAEDLAVGAETIIKIKDKLPYIVSTSIINYVEVKLDFKPITAFGIKEGVSFVSDYLVLPAQKDFDIKMVSSNLPTYTGEDFTASHSLKVTLSNLGCQDIPAGTQLKVGYLNTLPGNVTVWKDVALATAFKSKSEMTISFDGTIDLSAPGLHTYETFVTYSQDPVAANNSVLNACYNGIVTTMPYAMDFERTPGGWNTKSLKANQKFLYQASTISFRDTKSKNMWGTVDFTGTDRMTLNSDFTLESPIFDFTNVTSPYVEFDLYYLFHRGYDGLVVEYSEDKGQNWKKVTGIDYPETLDYNDFTEGSWFTGINTVLKKDPYQMRLNELAGKKVAIRFRVMTDDYQDGFLGAAIDNIKVSDAPYDLDVIASKLDAGKCTIDNTNITINTTIINNFATKSEPVIITTKILDSAKNEVFSKIEKTTLAFAKFRDTINYAIPNINLRSVGNQTVTVSVFPDGTSVDFKPQNNVVTFNYDNWNNEDEKVSVLPYKMDFEDASKYKGWRTFENKNATGWQHGLREDLGSPGWFLEDHTHFMASNDDKCNCDASNDMLVSPVFDLTNYKEAHLTFDGIGDALKLSDGYVKVSTDGGVTWKDVFKMPYVYAWEQYSVDLSAYAGKSCVQIAFQHNDNGLFAEGFAVDNIEIKETKDYLSLSNLSIAEVVYEDAPSHEFYISAKNVAYKTIDKVKIEYQITQSGKAVGTPVVLEKSDAILQGETIVYNINGLPQLAAGNYEINIKVSTDGQAQAQTAKGSFQVIDKALGLNFEAFSNLPQGPLFGSKGFVSNQSDENSPWKVVATEDNINLKLPKEDHTRDTAAMMLYSQLEADFYYSEVTSPVYKLSSTAAVLEFYYAMQSNYNDAVFVEVKPIGGQWTEIWRTTRQGTYEDTAWQKAVMNISKYKGKSIMLRFKHAKAGGYSYMLIDDLKVISEPVLDLSVQILSPRDICGTDEFKVKLTNEGQMDINANSIQLDLLYVNTAEAISEAVALGIPIGGSIEYTFKKQPKLDDKGDSHAFNLTAKLENDIITQNNEIKNYIFQNVAKDFKIFDSPIIHGYAGKSVYVNAASNFILNELQVASYTWNNGVVANGIDVKEAGDYTVTAVLKNGCTMTETVKVVLDTFSSDLPSGNVCGPEVALNPGNYQAYEWFDGSTDPIYITTESGDYYVTVYNESGLGKILKTSISIVENAVPEIQVIDAKKLAASADATGYQWYLNGRPIPNATQKMVATIWEGSYSLEVTNSNGCNRMSEAIDSKGLIVGELTNSFRVFPNPVVDDLNIFLADKIEGKTEIKIYSMDGKALWSKTYTNIPSNINVSDLNTGVYILDCNVNGKKYTAKIIKK